MILKDLLILEGDILNIYFDKKIGMGKYTLVVESKDGRVLKIDGVYLDIRNIPIEGGMLRLTADKIIDVDEKKRPKV